MVFPSGLDGKESACDLGDLDSIRGLGRSPEGGHGNPFQDSCLENPMDREAWQGLWGCKSRTQLSDLSPAQLAHIYIQVNAHIHFSYVFVYLNHWIIKQLRDI